ncbi:hypothetical protein C0991_003808 [Blastosporella zonata]|nr:hypothetical protein C0991_003808 [Blastosporella zonata]
MNDAVDDFMGLILTTEEYLLEAICFDLVVESPHAELVDLFDAYEKNVFVKEFAWSLAHDSFVAVYGSLVQTLETFFLNRYRTPLCILYPPKVIAAACYVLAQRMSDGPNSPSLDARISTSSPISSLPTPPSHKPPSPDASRYAIEYFTLNEAELMSIAGVPRNFSMYWLASDQLSEAMSILLEFYAVQDRTIHPHISPLVEV